MKKNYIVDRMSALFVLAVAGILVAGCSQNKTEQHKEHHQPRSSAQTIKAEYGAKTFIEETQGMVTYDTRSQNSVSSRVSGRIDRLWIKYNYQLVKKGQLIMEVYSPDLAAAQQELLFLKGDDPAMLQRAKQRLMLLGMTASGINQVLKSGKVNYRIPVYSNASGYIIERPATVSSNATPTAVLPSSAGGEMGNMGGASSNTASGPTSSDAPLNSPVMLREGQYVSAGQSLFTIYNADHLVAEFSLKPTLAAHVKKGDKFIYYKTSAKTIPYTSRIGMILPVFKNGGNFTLARVYLNNLNFSVGELLTARITISLPESWWLPASAVISLGNKTVLFKKEENAFLPKEIRTGVTTAGMVQVKEDISGWEISKNAAYLVDSEGFIKN